MGSVFDNLLSQTPDRLLTRKEERELARRAEEGDREARKKLIIYNHRLVVSVAKDYKGMGVGFEDLVMAGFEGLLKGIDRFDPQLGYKLSTYATWWIRQAVLRELDNHSTTIRVPGYLRTLSREVHRLEEKREEKLSPSQISEEFEVSQEVAHNAKQIRSTASLDSSFSRYDANLKDLIENRKAKKPSRATSKEESFEKLRAAMEEKLTDRERRILKLRFGVEDYQPRTLGELGEIFDLSRERIRQLQDRALEKLKESERVRGAAGDV